MSIGPIEKILMDQQKMSIGPLEISNGSVGPIFHKPLETIRNH